MSVVDPYERGGTHSRESRKSDLAPFFTDERSLREKMAADEREWRPTDPKYGCPPLIAGLVLERDTFLSTLGTEPELKPTLRILEMPANIEWKAIGFHGWLKREIETKNPQPGDYVVASHTGVKKTTKAGYSDGFMYRLYVERNPAGRVVPEQALEPELSVDDLLGDLDDVEIAEDEDDGDPGIDADSLFDPDADEAS
jgi:hypothetical protein